MSSEEIENLLAKYLPKKSVSEIIGELIENNSQVIQEFLVEEKESRQNWISKKIGNFENPTIFSEEEIDTETEEDSLSELHWMKEVLRFKPVDHEFHVTWAKDIEIGILAQEFLIEKGELLNQIDKKHLQTLSRIGQKSFELFTTHNLRLVWSIASAFTGNLSKEEHFQNGVFGLIRAIQGWDWRRGYQFSTYASWWIRQSIHRNMAETRYSIYLPVHIQEEIRSLQKFGQEFDLEVDYEKIEPEVRYFLENKRVLEKSDSSLNLALNVVYRNYSFELIWERYRFMLDPRIDEWDEEGLNAIMLELLNWEIENILYSLTERESAIIKMRFGMYDGQPKTLEEIGEYFGVTRERIRQIESKAMSKLRHPSRSEILKDYLDHSYSD